MLAWSRPLSGLAGNASTPKDGETSSIRMTRATSSPEIGLTGCYSTLVNNYVELLKTSAYMAGLTTHRRDHAKDVIELVRGDGGLTRDQADSLHQLFVLEGRVQHASPDVDADEVREAVELLRRVAPRLMRSVIEWLSQCGVEVAGPPHGASELVGAGALVALDRRGRPGGRRGLGSARPVASQSLA